MRDLHAVSFVNSLQRTVPPILLTRVTLCSFMSWHRLYRVCHNVIFRFSSLNWLLSVVLSAVNKLFLLCFSTCRRYVSAEKKPDENYSIRYNCRMVSPRAPPPTPMSLPDLSPQPTPLTEPIVREPLICLYNPADRQPIRYVKQSRPPPGYVPVMSTGDVYPPIFALEPRDSSDTTVIWNTVPGRRVMVQSGIYSPLLGRSLSMPRRRRSSVAYIPTSQTRYVTEAANWCCTISRE